MKDDRTYRDEIETGDLVFVYGTLRDGQPNNWILRSADRVGGSWSTVDVYRLRDLGAFPAAEHITGEPGAPGAGLVGEVYRVDAETGWALDRLEGNGQFRFTPPTHTLLAFAQALDELQAEGGVSARAARYGGNHQVCVTGMRAMGFTEYVPENLQGHIITSFLYPTENFDFEGFYDRLNNKGFVIYPGKVTKANCFRIGHIGHLFAEDTEMLLEAIGEVVREMNLSLV